jgi:hypothetical protein
VGGFELLNRFAAPVYPQLAAGERAITDVRMGGDTAVLTDRRVVVAGQNFEQSLPLAHIALVRVRFERIARDLVLAAVAILAAVVLFTIASPARTFLLNQTVALEPHAQAEREANEGNSLAQGVQRLVGVLASIARALPFFGWLLIIAAAAKLGLGILGRTVVTVAASGGEIEFAKRGRDRSLHEFIAEVGRQLPAP